MREVRPRARSAARDTGRDPTGSRPAAVPSWLSTSSRRSPTVDASPRYRRPTPLSAPRSIIGAPLHYRRLTTITTTSRLPNKSRT